MQEFVERGAEQNKDMAGAAHILPMLHSSGHVSGKVGIWVGREEQWGNRGHEGTPAWGRLPVGGTQPTAGMGLDGL